MSTLTITPELTARLRASGYKLTPPRLAVLQVIFGQGGHLNPAEILERVRKIQPGVGRASISRTVELLTQLGSIRPIYLGESCPIDIHAEGGHHHLVCSLCGKVIDFDQCTADQIADDLSARYGFTIVSHLLEFYGECAECKAGAG